jgi:hypothetical protein
MAAETVHQEWEETEEHLGATRQQNQLLQAQLNLLAEKAPQINLTITECLDSHEASAEENQAWLYGQPREQDAMCWLMTPLATLSQSGLKKEAWGSGSGSDLVRGESHFLGVILENMGFKK